MPIAITVTRQDKNDIYLIIVGTIALSGTYPTGGETVAIAGLKTSKTTPLSFMATGKAGFQYQYDYANAKLMVRVNDAGGANAPMGEHTNATYAAGVSGDTITFEAQYRTP